MPILPADAPVTATTEAMTKAFRESASANTLIAVLTNEKGLGPADDAAYRKLVDTLRADTKNVVMVQDFLNAPPLREILTSKDNKAWLLPVGVPGELGSTQSYFAATEIAKRVKEAAAGTTLTVNVTGPAATTVDMVDIGEKDRRNIEIAMAVMLLGILLVIYRNPLTMMLPLLTIGVSLMTANGVISAFAELGLAISTQTIVFLTAMIAGAGTDYAVFLISRYHDYLRLGESSDQAVQKAMASVGKVIAASAATVAITFLGISFARIGVFATVGIALGGGHRRGVRRGGDVPSGRSGARRPRGWIKPRRDLTARLWRRIGHPHRSQAEGLSCRQPAGTGRCSPAARPWSATTTTTAKCSRSRRIPARSGTPHSNAISTSISPSPSYFLPVTRQPADPGSARGPRADG